MAWVTSIRTVLESRLEGAVGPIDVVSAHEEPRGTTSERSVVVRAVVRTNAEDVGWIEAGLSRDGSTFTYRHHLPIAEPIPSVNVDPGWPTARRALFARDEALDVDGFEVLFEQIDAELDRLADADEATRYASPYLTPEGVRSLAFWADGPGLPLTGRGRRDAAWLAIEEDATHERIEVQCGLRVFGLCRIVGRPDAPWRLWRLRRGT